MTRRIRIGTRGSRLALWQAGWVARRLQQVHPGLATEIVEIRTTGDNVQDRPLDALGRVGAFTSELDQALLSDRVDIAVHSLKDLPTQLTPGIFLAATPVRGNPCDALVSRDARKLSDLPEGATVATGSLRRRAQLLALRPGIHVVGVRGNVDSRIRKLRESTGLDAIILAAAGIERLERLHEADDLLEPPKWLPAPGQAALGIAVREGCEEALQRAAAIDDASVRASVTAERAFLSACGGGCHVPVGAYAQFAEGNLRLDALIAAPGGAQIVRGQRTGGPHEAAELGAQLADCLLQKGGRAILHACSPED